MKQHTTKTMPDSGQGHCYRLAFGNKWHGCYGHLNLLTLDHDRPITDYGTHDRVVAFLPDSTGLYCRVDHLWQLGMPTVEQVLTAARKDQGIKGQWKLLKVEKWENGEHTDFYFVR